LSSAHICRAWAAPGLVSFDIAWVGFGCLQPDPLLGWSSGGITTYSPQRARLRGDMNFGDARTGDPGVEVGDAGEGDLATSTGALWLELSMVGPRGSWRVLHHHRRHAGIDGLWETSSLPLLAYFYCRVLGLPLAGRMGSVSILCGSFFFSFRFLISTAMHIPPSFGQAFFFIFLYTKNT